MLFQLIVGGTATGAIYALMAMGFALLWQTSQTINFAQGEFLMLGGMSAVTFSFFLPLPLAILLAVLLTSVVGALIDFIFIRNLKKPTVLNMIIVTIGLSILIREIALHVWDEKVRSLPYFTGDESTSIKILGAYISPQVLWVLGISTVIVVLLGFFFRFTIPGRSMRACSAIMKAARLCGINTKNMVTLSFMLSAAIGAVAGTVVSPITMTQYDSGTSLAIKGFAVAILGGLGSSSGAVLGGLIVGLLEAFSISILPLAYKDAIAIAILLLILFVKPSGLMGRSDVSALKEF
jgi:branched-chain amino acid transport system permease protein